METMVLKVTGMTCGGCVKSVTKVLTALPGVSKAEVTLQPGEAKVEFDAARTDRAAMAQAITDAGFEAN